MERDDFDDTARELVERVNGLFVGLLSPEEQIAFQHLCEKGEARSVYTGASGLMGLAKVHFGERALS